MDLLSKVYSQTVVLSSDVIPTGTVSLKLNEQYCCVTNQQWNLFCSDLLPEVMLINTSFHMLKTGI